MEVNNPPQMKYQQRPNLPRAVITSAQTGKIKTQQNHMTIAPLFLKTKAQKFNKIWSNKKRSS